MNACRFFLGIVAIWLLAGLAATLFAADPSAEQVAFFEKQVRPLLVEKCLKCHGETKQKGGLRLDSIEALLAGGDSGPAIVPGNPAESLLIEAVNHAGLEMPPTGKLPDPQIRTLTQWVKQGAPWPAGDHASTGAPSAPRGGLTAEDRAYWFFQPLRAVEPANVANDNWSKNPIDRFVLAKLRAEGIEPAPAADPGTFIRRLTFDLTGLPPTPVEVSEYVAAYRRDPEAAVNAAVERLLASPRYGERWARHWLDLVRYAESDGFRADGYRPHAWPYRDYVIQSFNTDKSYARFLTEQIAGDELEPDNPEMRVAAEYYRLGTYEHNQRDVPSQRTNILNEITDVTGEVFLGLGFGCARCHDHKFDPILQVDYFRLQAFFTPLQWRDDLSLATTAEEQDYQVRLAAWQLQTADLRERIAKMEASALAKSRQSAFEKFPPETKGILLKPVAEQTPYERQIDDLAARQYEDEGPKLDTLIKGEAKTKWQALLKELAGYDSMKPDAPMPAFTATDVGGTAPPTVIPGDRREVDIAPGTPSALSGHLAELPAIHATAHSTGRRSALAAWLTRPDNPMTSRVIANRLWQYHFGRGIVTTASDYGRLGTPPTHPELLDWLAAELVRGDWSIKAIHRLIATSATYRQASRVPISEAVRIKDPENRWLHHMNARRLEAEPIRDAILAVTGEMKPHPGGPAADPSKPVRTVYTKVTRNTRDEILDAFDAPDASLSTAQRNATITPTQSLLMMNGPWLIKRAEAFARRLRSASPDSRADQVRLAYRLALGRDPNSGELQQASEFLDDQSQREKSGNDAALADFCHALLNSNEFLYVD